MGIVIFDVVKDSVIESIVATGKSSYEFALDNLLPLTNRFDAQRKSQDHKFYKRLERDILDGCVMPPLTIAFVNSNIKKNDDENLEGFINKNIENGYILDGIQRLNTLNRIKNHQDLDKSLPIYLNIIIAPTEDKLLYRMITLNNGQKPMTPRHQIEILTQELFDFKDLNIDIQTEKERAKEPVSGSFNLGDISRAYLAFLTNEVNNEKNKIIGEKMDQIIVRRIMEKKPESNDFDFKDVLAFIDKFSVNQKSKKWLKVVNNLIGFTVGMKSSFAYLQHISEEDFSLSIQLFDEAFKGINPSKVNLGKFRRVLSKAYFENYEEFSNLDEIDLIEQFAELTS